MCRGTWLVLLEPSKAFKKFKGHTRTGTVIRDEPLGYSAEAKPLVVEDRGGGEADAAALFWAPAQSFSIPGGGETSTVSC